MTFDPVQNGDYHGPLTALADICPGARSSFCQTELDNPARSVTSSTQRHMSRADMDSVATKYWQSDILWG
jgi:hypothetical protein